MAGGLLASLYVCETALAQKQGGILRMPSGDSPASMSIHEESTIAVLGPMMGVFNNLVMFDQHVKQNSLQSIVPDLATSWSWNEEGTTLTFTLREGVKWHDGKPFTARDVQCTWDLITGKSSEKFRVNPRKSWYRNLEQITANGDYEVSFHLKRPQSAFLALVASGWSPVYPCHVAPRDMRSHPIGTGPFKFVEFKPNESIKVARNPDYWKKDRPYLDGIEWTVIRNPSTAVMAFAAGNFDRYAQGILSIPLMKQIKNQAPNAICEVVPWNISRALIVNRATPPFDNPNLRQAMALSLDRQAYIDIVSGGKASIAGNMMPPPQGVWGMPNEMLVKLPGYGPDVAQQQSQARRIMEGLGYGPAKRLKVKVSTRDFASYRDPAVIFVDQLNKVHFDAELEIIESSIWHNRLIKTDYTVALNTSGVGIDDPDAVLKGAYGCNSEANYTRYCSPEVERLLDLQSQQSDLQKRTAMVWEIERKLAEDVARPIVYHNTAATCWHPHLQGYVHQENSIYNNWRFDQVWLEK